MANIQGYKALLNPTTAQSGLLEQYATAAIWTWNWGLAQKRQGYSKTGRSPNYVMLSRALTKAKKNGDSWLYDIPAVLLQQVLIDLDKAYKSFFVSTKLGGNSQFPQLKMPEESRKEFRLYGSIQVTDTHIKLPKLGWIKLAEKGTLPTEYAKLHHIAILQMGNTWSACVICAHSG